MQSDYSIHRFKEGSYFENVIDRYNFDRNLRLILFDAIEHIEIAIRTKMIYILSLSYGGLWYLNDTLFASKDLHTRQVDDLKREFSQSQEIFIKDHRNRFPDCDADSWKILEIASLGTLSKFYKNLIHNLPEKANIAKEMGLNSHKELASWLESITYIRNIIAHHSRLWSRNMVKKPISKLNNPTGAWLGGDLKPVQLKRPFLIISTMIYLCDKISHDQNIKERIKNLFHSNENIPIYKIGFFNNWESEPLWK